MSVVDSFLKKMKMDSEDDYDDDRYDDDDEYNDDDDDFDDDYDEPKSRKKSKKNSVFSKKKAIEDDFDDDYDDEEEEELPKNIKGTSAYRPSSYSSSSSMSSKNNVVGMRPASSSGIASSQSAPARPAAGSSEVCMIVPKSFEDANTIADVLLSHKAVVLNLESIDMAAAQRIIDFASGACYTVGGNLQKISKKIFMIVPQDMNLSGDFDVNSMNDMVDLNQVNILK